ncbi:unnamed protein product [Phytophthora fragariaefolia]|uniref:Unnamed protein product n=1 Tax=Phytophthora fragariaefolia TaxID=1490495 RepID=A0A9W7DF07_9STRA|nr:unnamed protein product [Phytophthora fragariaefolia]
MHVVLVLEGVVALAFHAAHAGSANAASGTPSGGGSAAPSVSLAPPARNDGCSSSDESEEEVVEWQPSGSKEVSPNSEAQERAPSPSPKSSGPVSDNPPPDTEVGETTGPQVISVDRANTLQALGLLPSERGSSSGMPEVVEIPPGEPSDPTVRVVGVPATECHNDGRTFLQDGFGGLEALVQMEILGATELAVLYDFFDDNDIIGDFILTPRETPLTATELSSQLKNFAVKRELASILSQFDFKQLALRTFGTVSLLRKVAAKYNRIKRKLAEDDGAASVIELQVLRFKRDQQLPSSYWIEKVAEVQRESETLPWRRCARTSSCSWRCAKGISQVSATKSRRSRGSWRRHGRPEMHLHLDRMVHVSGRHMV